MAPRKKNTDKPLDKQLEEALKEAKNSEDKILVLGRYATTIVNSLKKGMNRDEERYVCVTIVRLYKCSAPEIQRACLRVLGMMKAESSGESIFGLEAFGWRFAKDESVKQELVNIMTS